MAEQIPEAWEGQEVTILHYATEKDEQHTGVLGSIHERGVVLKRNDLTYFFPWTSIIYIWQPSPNSGTASSSWPDAEGFGEF